MKIEIDFKNTKNNNYTIFINELDKINLNGKVAIITNTTIAPLHVEKFISHVKAKELQVIQIPDGEEYKNLKTIENILNQLFELKFNRHSTLIAFGGGVVGDITGFCASIYQRGIDFIQVPTTLLACVDASVGGKTGVNNAYGKNLIGSFYQPKAVYCQTEFLKTLPMREFRAGIAEIVKKAVVLDKDLLEFLENNDLYDETILPQAIEKSLKLKAKIVAKDENEKGLRSVLNYGHTFAHVVENQTDYKRFLHGEAVALGMIMANELALHVKLLSKSDNERIYNLLEKYNLIFDYKIEDIDRFYEMFFLDKKSLDNNVRFVLPSGIGSYEFKDDLSKESVLNGIRKFYQ